jgi:hypothetical protein
MTAELESESYYLTVPVEVADVLVGGADPVARPAPGVRVDLGTAVDAVQVSLQMGSDLVTLIVGAYQLQRFASRLVEGLRHRGENAVRVDSPDGPSNIIEVSDEDLYRELLRRLEERDDES